jgi:hypothetical protein
MNGGRVTWGLGEGRQKRISGGYQERVGSEFERGSEKGV